MEEGWGATATPLAIHVYLCEPRYSLPRCDLQSSHKLSQTCYLFASKSISSSQRGLGHLLVSTVSRHHMSLRSHMHPHPCRSAPTWPCNICLLLGTSRRICHYVCPVFECLESTLKVPRNKLVFEPANVAACWRSNLFCA